MQLTATTDTLNAISFDQLFASAAPLLNRAAKNIPKVTVDLNAVKFIDPYGVAGLIILLETIRRRSNVKPRLIAPTDVAVWDYLRRLGAVSHLRNTAQIDGVDETLAARERDSDVLLGLTPIRSQADVDEVLSHLTQIVSVNLGYSAPSVNAILNTLSELCHNVLDHSDATGWAVAQRYFRRTGACFVRISVVDAGIGIKESLGKRFSTASWSHFDAIENALKKNFSRFPNRGMGLHMVGRIVGEFRGTLDIRTGDCRLFVGHQACGIPGAWFPGTQVGLSLSERKGP